MGYLFVLLDQTDGAATTDGSKLTPAVLAKGAALLTAQLNHDVAAFHGIPGGAIVRAGSSPLDIQPNERPFRFVAKLPVASAIAYHTVDGAGVPSLYDAPPLSDSLWGADNGWLCAVSHELIETIGDPGVNRLCSDGTGKLWDEELCDPVEVQSYEKKLPDGTSGFVSNFVTRAWFTPNARGPFDYMTAAGLANQSAPPGPFTVAPGGGGNYAMWETDPQAEQEVNAKRPPTHGRKSIAGVLAHRLAKKAWVGSRAHRRGLRMRVAP